MDVSAEAYTRNGRRAEGLAEGMSKAQIEIAGKMLESGMTTEQVMQFTGLDKETVESL